MPAFSLIIIYTVSIAVVIYSWMQDNVLAFVLSLVMLLMHWLLSVCATEMFSLIRMLNEIYSDIVEEYSESKKEGVPDTGRRESLQKVLNTAVRVYNEERPRFFGRQRD